MSKKSERYKIRLENQLMEILGDIRKVPDINITVAGDGSIAISFDEYNRIAEIIDRKLKRERKINYK